MNSGRFISPIGILLLLAMPHMGLGQISSIIQVNPTTITCVFSIPQYSIVDTILPSEYGTHPSYNYIRMEDPASGVYDSVGFPELPFLSYSFEIPNGAYDCEIEMTDVQYDAVDISKLILPCQGDINKDDTVTSFPFSQNQLCYTSDQDFIPELCKLSAPFVIRGKKGVRAIIMPFKYNPYRNQLRVIKSAKILIRYSLGNGNPEYAVSKVWDNILDVAFVNHSQSQQHVDENYLIVTLPKYEEAMQYFADYKRSLGYNVSTILLEEGQRTPERIKQLIRNQYDDPDTRPDYVLLVGSHPELPAYMGDSICDSTQNIDNPITDVPYVFLEGNDYYRDALIGRWPVSSVGDVKRMANKTIYMEMNMHQWEKKAVFIAGYDDSPAMINSFESGLESIREGTFTPLGYNCSQLNQPDRVTALNKLNDNPLIYIYSGHGYCYAWSRIQDNNEWDFDFMFIELSNHQVFPMAFAFACQTCNYACYDVSVAEEWMRRAHGGITYMGSSVYTRPICDNRIEKKVLGESFTEVDNIGGIMGIGMKRFYDSFFTWPQFARRYMKAYNLMGDPSFRVRGLGCVDDYYVDQLRLRSGDIQYYLASENVTFSDDVNISSGSELIVRACDEIVFKNGFIASAGAEVSAVIEECIEQQRGIGPIEEPSNESGGKSVQPSVDSCEINSVKVYPNPAKSQVMVEFTYATEGSLSLQILDIFGRKVLEFEEELEIGTYQKAIDFSSLPSGCYYVVITNNETRIVKCIIKQ